MEILVKVLCLCAFIGQLSASAIPMWEYLSKQEKMSYLYSMFANQVEDFCETVTMKDCNRELLKYGLDKLKDMPEDHLDTMDPYQRGANTMIWNAMMDGHEMSSTTPKPEKVTATTTPKPNSYEDNFFDKEFGNQGAGSARIDTIYRVPPPKGFVFKIETGKPLYTYPRNYQYIQRRPTRFPSTTTQSSKIFSSLYIDSALTGPMEVRVYPDGTPVHDSRMKLPEDDDLRQYQLSKIKIPNL